MSLRIACDLDGTVADMDGALDREAERLFGPGVTLRADAPLPIGNGASKTSAGPADAQEHARGPRVLSAREVKALWSHVRKIEDFWTTLDELESGSVRRFAELAMAHRWHVVFMTRRPQTRGENAQVQSQRWLQQRGFSFPSVCVVSHSRGKVAGLLGFHVVIDDRPETCLDVVADSDAESILVWRTDPSKIPAGVTGLGVNAVASFGAALDRLEAVAEASRGGGFIDRIRSALGGD